MTSKHVALEPAQKTKKKTQNLEKNSIYCVSRAGMHACGLWLAAAHTGRNLDGLRVHTFARAMSLSTLY